MGVEAKPEMDNSSVMPPKPRYGEEDKVPNGEEEKTEEASPPLSKGLSTTKRSSSPRQPEEFTDARRSFARPPDLERGQRQLPGQQPGAVAVGGDDGPADNTIRYSSTAPSSVGHTTNSVSQSNYADNPIVAEIVERDSIVRARRKQQWENEPIPMKVILKNRRIQIILLVLVAIILGLVTVLVVLQLQNSNSGSNANASASDSSDDAKVTESPTFAPSRSTTLAPSAEPTETVEPLIEFLSQISPDGGAALLNETSPQRKAYEWLDEHDMFGNLSSLQISQIYALQVFRFILLGESGYDLNFELDRRLDEEGEVCSYHCCWTGVVCNAFQAVTSYRFDYKDATFYLPDEMILLSELTYLSLISNKGYGTLPQIYAQLTKLEDFITQGNYYTGTIPTVYATMPRLRHFVSHNNRLEGSIPSEFGLTTTLEGIYLSFNGLRGTIPPELFDNANLCHLSFEKNELTGTLPTSLTKYTILKSIDVSRNSLSGTIPTDVAVLTELDSLRLSSNRFSGPIPSELKAMASLNNLELDGNDLTGTIPVEITFLTSLDNTLGLGENELTGTIPTELGRLRNIRSVRLHRNRFVGTIPTQLGFLTGITHDLDLESNQLTGALPSELGRLTQMSHLHLESNQGITGTIPESFQHLTLLAELTAYDNWLTGSVPEGLCDLQRNGSLYKIELDCNLNCSCCGEFCF